MFAHPESPSRRLFALHTIETKSRAPRNVFNREPPVQSKTPQQRQLHGFICTSASEARMLMVWIPLRSGSKNQPCISFEAYPFRPKCISVKVMGRRDKSQVL